MPIQSDMVKHSDMIKHKLSIMVVEDNKMMQEALAELLQEEGHSVTLLDCAEAFGELAQDQFDILILDISLPGEDGLSISQRLRTVFPRLGIIMLTARNQPEDTIQGYLHGTDNYFTKPFNPQVLLAAIQNLGQRVISTREASFALLELNIRKKTLSQADQTISLTATEALILQNFILAPKQTLENWQLQSIISSEEEPASLNYLQVDISRLRKKLMVFTGAHESIKNLREKGYCLTLHICIKN